MSSTDEERKHLVLIAKLIPCFKLNGFKLVFSAIMGFDFGKCKQKEIPKLLEKYNDLFECRLILNKNMAVFSKYFPNIPRNSSSIPGKKYHKMIKLARNNQYMWHHIMKLHGVNYELKTFRKFSHLFIVTKIQKDASEGFVIVSRIYGSYYLDSKDDKDEIERIINVAKDKMPILSNQNNTKSNIAKPGNGFMKPVFLSETQIKMQLQGYFVGIAKLFPCIQFDNDGCFKQFCVVLFGTDLISLANMHSSRGFSLRTLLLLFVDLFIVQIIHNGIQIRSKYFINIAFTPKNYNNTISRMMIKLARQSPYIWYDNIKSPMNIKLKNMAMWDITVFMHHADLFFVVDINTKYIIVSRIFGIALLMFPDNVIRMALHQSVMSNNIINSGVKQYGYQNESEIITTEYESNIKLNKLNDLNKQYSQLNDIITKQHNQINGLNQLNHEMISKNKSLQHECNDKSRDCLQLKCDDNALNELNMDELCNLHDKCIDIARIIKKEIQERRENELICNICCDNENNAVFDPCGHIGCYNCLTQLNICHICRSQITRVIQFKL